MKKFDLILNRERRNAQIVAERVMKAKMDFGWKILIPILLFLDYAVIRRRIKVAKENLLFTKKMALEAAWDIKGGEAKKARIEKLHAETKKVLGEDKGGVYSEKIRKRQLKEMEILVDHYLRLLNAEGKNYKELVKNAYETESSYHSFIEQLEQAERGVNQAAIMTLGGNKKELSEWFDELESTTKYIRQKELEDIFLKE